MYKRILLKLSGESLAHGDSGIDGKRLHEYAQQVKAIADKGVQIGIVIGGGNIFRGVAGTKTGIDRVTGDHMGMLATCINALALASALQDIGQPARVLTAIKMEPVAEYFSTEKALRLLEQKNVLIFAGGTGNPLFTTDSGAALRAIEIKADVMFKGTRVDGIYDSDPEKNPDAKKYDTISYDDAIAQNLKVMDTTAIALCKESKMPIYVFNMDKKGNLEKVMNNEKIGTLVIP